MGRSDVARRYNLSSLLLSVILIARITAAVPNPLPAAAPLPVPLAAPNAAPTAYPVPEAELLKRIVEDEVQAGGLVEEAADLTPRGYCGDNSYCAFSGAVYITGGGACSSGECCANGNCNGGYQSLSPAQQAQCPAGYPTGCSAIGRADYCCPSSNYCAFDSNNAVACCPNGQTCEGAVGSGGTYQTTTVYNPQTTTVYNGGGVVIGGGVVTTTEQGYYAGYCSTLYAVGPGLPTTQAGSCGTILVTEPAEAARLIMSIVKLLLTVGVLQIAGGAIFGIWRIR